MSFYSALLWSIKDQTVHKLMRVAMLAKLLGFTVWPLAALSHHILRPV
jgi:hypothetical protein